jgi:hypothetical protein
MHVLASEFGLDLRKLRDQEVDAHTLDSCANLSTTHNREGPKSTDLSDRQKREFSFIHTGRSSTFSFAEA